MISLPTGSVRHGQWTEVHHRRCHWGKCPLRQSETALALFLPDVFVFDRISSPLQLNAFDSRHLDEIHFDVRLMAFQKATKHIKEMSTLDMRYLTVVMHNCFHSLEVTINIWDSCDVTISVEYLFLCVFCIALLWVLNAFCVFLRQIGDMSLADSATMCLSAIIVQLSEIGCPEAEYREIVQYTILNALQKGLKSKTEVKMSDVSAYINYSTALYIPHAFDTFISFFPECTKWIHYGSGLPGEDISKPIRVSRSGSTDSLYWSWSRFLWAYEAHTGNVSTLYQNSSVRLKTRHIINPQLAGAWRKIVPNI